MSSHEYKFFGEVWRYPGTAGWHFVSVPKKISEDIRNTVGKQRKGWGSVPVRMNLGEVSWTTSVFPDKKSGEYLLPLKSEIRKKANVFAGESIPLVLHLQAHDL